VARKRTGATYGEETDQDRNDVVVMATAALASLEPEDVRRVLVGAAEMRKMGLANSRKVLARVWRRGRSELKG
jgi:hypothetical protein